MLNILNTVEDKISSKFKVCTVTMYLKRNNADVIILIALVGIFFQRSFWKFLVLFILNYLHHQ